MFKKRTLFIVGAGASNEFDLPLGTKLAASIALRCDFSSKPFDDKYPGDRHIKSALARHEHDELNEFLQAGHRIRDGVQLSHSIDDFLDIHAADKFVNRTGKMAIVRAVLEAEAQSTLHFDTSNINNKPQISRFENTWLVKFIRTLVRGVPKEKASTVFDNVAFIVFNYDRCIEHLLFHGLHQVFSIPREEAAKLLSGVTILHPYGQVAPLKTTIDGKGVQYGGEEISQYVDCYELSNGIKTYTEASDDAELKQIYDQVEKAERMVFLGFAFHDQNLHLIKPKGGIKRRDIYATAFGMSDSDVSVVRAQLLDFFTGHDRERMEIEQQIIIENDLTCAQWFDQYSKSLPA